MAHGMAAPDGLRPRAGSGSRRHTGYGDFTVRGRSKACMMEKLRIPVGIAIYMSRPVGRLGLLLLIVAITTAPAVLFFDPAHFGQVKATYRVNQWHVYAFR